MALTVPILVFMLSGVVLGCYAGTWRIIPLFMSCLPRVVSAGAPGHGPVHSLLSSASSLGFSWDSDSCVWLRPGLPALCQISSPFQFFAGGCLGVLGELRLLATLVLGLVFGVAGIWIFVVP